jgi:hypothetical protein
MSAGVSETVSTFVASIHQQNFISSPKLLDVIKVQNRVAAVITVSAGRFGVMEQVH